MLIGIVGLNGSGKDTAAQYLVENHSFAHRDLGQEIRNELKNIGKNHMDRSSMIAHANEMRQKHGFNYWCKKAIESTASKDIVITSIRNPGEAEEIRSRRGFMVEIFADQKTRFERTIERVKNNQGAHGDVQSFENFRAMEEKELRNDDPAKQQLLSCIKMADYRIENNGTKEHLHSQIEKLLAILRNKDQ